MQKGENLFPQNVTHFAIHIKKTVGKKHWLSKVLLKTTSWIFFRLRTFPLRETGIGFVFKKWDQGGVFLIVELDKSGMCSVLQIYSIYDSLWFMFSLKIQLTYCIHWLAGRRLKIPMNASCVCVWKQANPPLCLVSLFGSTPSPTASNARKQWAVFFELGK